ncbi:hypothetical protein F5Y18DRAFT_375987 [Xylariaceae sp. FL1019]|nr:hypothetical protein F5Y18DRAFT_375987 [Xylariaceae sp. FL1019]
MPFKKHGRQYDVVVLGATGYTGLMVAEHITTHFPTNCKWAIAGRSAQKLEGVVKKCQSLDPDRQPPHIEVCGLNDVELSTLARKSYWLFIITTVGPFAQYGEVAFKACAEAGTHYFDCTGESAWHKRMINRYERAAQASGAMMFPQAGVESAPSDLVTFALASTIKSESSAPTGDVVVSLHELHSLPSGGTLATVMSLFETFSFKEVSASHHPYSLSPVTNSKQAPKASLWSKLTGGYRIPGLGLLTTSVTAGTDAAVVWRSWGLFKKDPVLKQLEYGPNFTYREFTRASNMLTAAMAHYALIIGGILLAFCPPFRSLVRKFIYQPGEGPTREAAAKDYIEFRGVGTPDIQTGPKKLALCKASYSGSMYQLTAEFLGQGALVLLEEDTKLGGGIYTPACLANMGFLDRLSKSGFKVETQMVDA